MTLQAVESKLRGRTEHDQAQIMINLWAKSEVIDIIDLTSKSIISLSVAPEMAENIAVTVTHVEVQNSKNSNFY